MAQRVRDVGLPFWHCNQLKITATRRGLATNECREGDCGEECEGEGCGFWDGGDAEIEGAGLHFEDVRHDSSEC